MKRPCGLYRSDRPIETAERVLDAPALLFLHDHSPDSRVVLVPLRNEHNRWRFAATGTSVDDELVASLVHLRPEGLYRLREHVHLGDARVVPASSLVQLGYTPRAEPLIFFPRRADDQNAVTFPERGTRISPAIYELLERLDLRGPVRQTPLH